MKIKKKTVLNLLVISLVLSFFVTPLGFYGKVFLQRIFASTPEVITIDQRKQINDYDWRLKDAEWNVFNFKKSEGKVVFINLWASWKLTSYAELKSIQELYDAYHTKVDFYIITNENRPPVEAFMKKNDFTFPVTYLIIGDKMPINAEKIPSSYLIDDKGAIVIYEDEIADWNSNKVNEAIESLIAE